MAATFTPKDSSIATAGGAAARVIAGTIPGARLEIVPQQGDAPHTGAPEAVAAAARSVAG